MTKRRGSPARPPKVPKAKPGTALERLDGDEGLAVLHRLLGAHPDLRAEAEQTARLLLSEVSFEAVADAVEHAVRSLDLDDLGSRAGRHSDGYTSPTDAAWELLDEAVAPYVSDMKRQIELGLEREALEICKGVMLGLYRARATKGDEFLGWAEDFPAETAADALSVLVRSNEKKLRGARSARLRFDQEFVAKAVPEWRDLVARVLARGGT